MVFHNVTLQSGRLIEVGPLSLILVFVLKLKGQVVIKNFFLVILEHELGDAYQTF